MLDIKFIKENKEKVKEAILNKGIDLDLDYLLSVDRDRVVLSQEIESLRSDRKQLSEMGKNLTEVEQKEISTKGKMIRNQISKLEVDHKEIKRRLDGLMARVPSVPSPDTPIGKDSDKNIEIFRFGEIPTFSFKPKNHIEIAKDLDLIDFERGAKVAGYRGYYLKNEGVLLVLGTMMYALQKLISKGYLPMIPPTLIKQFALFGSGYFKDVEYNSQFDEIYQIANFERDQKGNQTKENKFLVGTAEPSLLAYYSGEVLEKNDLPKKLCGFSQCYRSEIGSYGKDTKGIYRVHEFMKVEQVVITSDDLDLSNSLQDEMVQVSKELHEDLKLPYRILQICTGDMSPGKYRAFDIEAWMPGLNRFGETGSASNFLDWQSRRLNVKYKDGQEKKYAFMLNNTALASPRTLIAILENYQQADGSLVVPEVLRAYVGKEVITKK